MSHSSESENEVMAHLLEATDKNFLTDELFNSKLKSQNLQNLNQESNQKSASMNARTRRYCSESDIKTGTDAYLIDEMKTYFTKKFTKLVGRETGFFQGLNTAHSEEILKSNLMLFKGADCYVKPYDAFEYNKPGSKEKLKIKRRKLADETELTIKEKISAATICYQHILSGNDVKAWAFKPKRCDRFFSYKTCSNNKLISTN